MKCVDDFRLRFGRQELVPIVIGGMGVDISTAELALEVARLGGIGHISDAMVQTVSDRRFDTKFVSEKLKKYKTNAASSDKSNVHFNLAVLEEATRYHVGRTMEAKRGDGMIFINCMEKLTMNAPRETLRMRLSAALDAGIDGITLSAGLHLGSFALIEDHPRWRCSCARTRGCSGCRTTSWWKARSPAATSASASRTGRSTTLPPSWARC